MEEAVVLVGKIYWPLSEHNDVSGKMLPIAYAIL